jgi:hypothetical protein
VSALHVETLAFLQSRRGRSPCSGYAAALYLGRPWRQVARCLGDLRRRGLVAAVPLEPLDGLRRGSLWRVP